tara:strand:+ start:39 stop:656 length:618 start_codon:yes stop_codon:yes gene_type:complete
MEQVIRFLFFKIADIINYVKKLFSCKNYCVKSIEMTYTHDGIDDDINEKSKFWEKESRYWTWRQEPESSSYWEDVTHCLDSAAKIPECVYNVLFKIKYFYNGKWYSCITPEPFTDVKHINDNTQMKFSMPIKSAILEDKDGKEIRNVTPKLVRFMGPRKNFHGVVEEHDIILDDLFEDIFENIRITDLVGVEKLYRHDSNIHLLL